MSYLNSYKQDTLVSGTNIKTINGSSILGSGNLVVSSATTWGSITGTLSSQTDLQTALNAKQDTITLTTTGSSGASTFIANTLNIPTYTLTGLGGVPTTRTISTTSPLSGGGDLSADRTLSISQATTSTDGYLSSTDWNTFNGKQDLITNNYGITGTTTKSVSLSSASAYITAETIINGTVYQDLTGASISLAAGTWLVIGTIYAKSAANSAINVSGAIRDGANTVVTEGNASTAALGAGNVGYVSITLTGIVTHGVTTSYKLSAARNQPANNATADDGNNVNANSDKGTNIMAIRIA